MLDKVNFNIFYLLIESLESATLYNIPQKKDFENINKSYSENINGDFHIIKTNIQDEYIWISIEYGSTMPHRNTLVNVKDKTEKDNSRGEDEAELLKQLFFLYHFDSNSLYLSNIRRINFFVKLFKKIFNINILIKSYYKSMDEFQKILTNVGEISFGYAKNLFSNEGDMGSILENLVGVDIPEQVTLKATFNGKKIPKSFLNRLSKEYENHRLERLIICGKGDKDLDIIYNPDTFIQKISILLEKNDEGIFNSNETEKELLRKIHDYSL